MYMCTAFTQWWVRSPVQKIQEFANTRHYSDDFRLDCEWNFFVTSHGKNMFDWFLTIPAILICVHLTHLLSNFQFYFLFHLQFTFPADFPYMYSSIFLHINYIFFIVAESPMMTTQYD